MIRWSGRHSITAFAAVSLLALGAVSTGIAEAQVSDRQPWAFMLQDDEPELERRLWAEGGVFTTDNADRATLGSEDNVLFTRAGGTLVREAGRFSGALRGDLEYRHYLQNTYDDEALLNADLAARATLAEDRVFWVLEDTFGQLLTDTRQPDIVTNRGDANVFRTGPDFVARLSEQSRMEASARYEQSYFEATDLEGSSVSGNVGVYRLVGETDTLSARIERTDFTPSSDIRPEYDVSRALARWQRRAGGNLIAAEVGIGRLAAAGATSSQAVGEITFNRSLRSALVLELSVSRDFSDSADLFFDIRRSADEQSPVDLQARQLPVQTTRAEAALRWERQRTQLWLQLGLLSEKPDDSFGTFDALGDRTTRSVRASLERRLSTQTTLMIGAEYLKREADQAGGDDRNTTASIAVQRRFGRRVTGQLGYQYWRRASDDAALSYTENRFRLTARYAWR